MHTAIVVLSLSYCHCCTIIVICNIVLLPFYQHHLLPSCIVFIVYWVRTMLGTDAVFEMPQCTARHMRGLNISSDACRSLKMEWQKVKKIMKVLYAQQHSQNRESVKVFGQIWLSLKITTDLPPTPARGESEQAQGGLCSAGWVTSRYRRNQQHMLYHWRKVSDSRQPQLLKTWMEIKKLCINKRWKWPATLLCWSN